MDSWIVFTISTESSGTIVGVVMEAWVVSVESKVASNPPAASSNTSWSSE